MRTMQHWAMAAAAATALALAGCGGGGSSSAPPSSDPPPPSALSFATDLNGSVDALETLSGAADDEGSALMMASENVAKIGTLASDGNSMAAMMSAQAVLNARKMLADAIDDANEDLTEAKEAKGNTEDEDVIAALDLAISAAETAIKDAGDILDGDDLTGYVEMVTGDDEDDVKTAADRGEEVAMAVAMALGPMVPEGGTSTANGAGLRASHGTTAPVAADVAAANRYQAVSRDPESMTWAMIVGEDNVVDKRIADGTTGNNKAVKAASVAGMVLVSEQTAGDVDDGIQVTTGIEYKGIPGTVFCGGSDCKVEAVADVGTDGEPGFVNNAGNRKLVGSWYFTPTDPMAFWTKAADATVYTADTAYVRYGHWLVVADNGEVTVNTFANRADGGSAAGEWGAADPSSDNAGMRATSAVYNGMAAGRSVHKTLDGDGAITHIQSGRFTASVTLTAEFGSSPMLGGTIDKFMSPDNPYAVDPDWTVELMKTASPGGEVAATAGVTKATGQDGTWSAASYGEAGMRPTGIFGGFNAHFTDGHVAGAYATRND